MTSPVVPTGPLSGVRVLDLTAMVSGPMATMILGDQGADVIKIEPPAGDIMRHFGVKHRGVSASFLSCNRSKRSLCVDLKSKEGIEIVKKLAATADVLVQNFRPGAIERMGLGEDVIRAIRPDIIYVSISGFGETGPYAHKRVYDPVIQAVSGLADVQANPQTRRPGMVRTIIPDKTTSVVASQAITAALFARERTGEGQHVRLSMLDTMVAFLWPEASSSLTYVGNEVDPIRGQISGDLVFDTQDGFITAGAISDSEWAGMCRAFNREDLIEDERFRTAAGRSENVVERRRIMGEEIARWPTDEILERLDREGVPSGPVLSRIDVLDNEQVIENDIIQVIDDPDLGDVRQPRPAARFAGTPAAIQGLAPKLGADNAAILEELGYSPADRDRLAEEAVTRQA